MPNLDRLGNKILDWLPEPDLRLIAALVERLSPPLGQVVAQPERSRSGSTSR